MIDIDISDTELQEKIAYSSGKAAAINNIDKWAYPEDYGRKQNLIQSWFMGWEYGKWNLTVGNGSH